MNTGLLHIDDLRIALPTDGERAYAVNGVSLSIDAGESLCIVGESGSGKSVLASAIAGLLAPALKLAGGSITLEGEPIVNDGRQASNKRMRAMRGKSIGFVFQEPMTALNPVQTCGSQVDEVLREHTNWSRAERKRRILAVFERVRLPEPERIYSSYPHQLSGGQRQRVVIAIAVILEPRLLICDEPTTALDVTTQAEVLKLIAEIQQAQGIAVLFITHDMGIVADIADRVLVMHKGDVVEQGTTEEVLVHPRQPYTKALLAAVPQLEPPPARRIEGTARVLEVEGLGKVYKRRDLLGRVRETEALKDAAVAVLDGETVGIVGESGSGKSTLARCVVRLIDPSAGDIRWGGEPIATLPERRLRPLRSRVQMVFQDPNRSLNPRRTIGSSLIEGVVNFGASRAEALSRAEQLLDRVRMPRTALARYPHQFSGGQRQRLALARALACQPKVLVADEAVSALDVSIQAEVLELLREIQATTAIGILFITHDLRVAAQLCDRIVVMQHGRIVEQGLTGDVYRNPRHEYTRRLIDAVPGMSVGRPTLGMATGP